MRSIRRPMVSNNCFSLSVSPSGFSVVRRKSAATCSARSTRSTRRAATWICADDLSNPFLVAATSYRPGCRFVNVKTPSASVTVARSVPWSRLWAMICASASGFLVAESRVIPPTRPTDACPSVGSDSVANKNAAQDTRLFRCTTFFPLFFTCRREDAQC